MQTDRHAYRHADRQACRSTDMQIDMPTADIQTDMQTVRQNAFILPQHHYVYMCLLWQQSSSCINLIRSMLNHWWPLVNVSLSISDYAAADSRSSCWCGPQQGSGERWGIGAKERSEWPAEHISERRARGRGGWREDVKLGKSVVERSETTDANTVSWWTIASYSRGDHWQARIPRWAVLV